MIANHGRAMPRVWRPIAVSTLVLGALALHAGTATAKPGESMEKLAGVVWVEGPGYDVTYGGNYEKCVARCLGVSKCVMIEYYRPELKCNLHSSLRPRKSGGSSYVAIRKTSTATAISDAKAEPQLLEPPKQVTRASAKRDSREGRAARDARENRDPRS